MDTPTNTNTGIPRMLTIAEVAELIGKSKYSTRALARLGRIPGARRIGGEWRFRRHLIERFVNGGAK